jgi:cell division protease FtsH
VTSLLTEHKDQLEKLADALVARETLEDSEIRVLLGFPPREARA